MNIIGANVHHKFTVSIRHVGDYILRILDGNNICVNVELVTNESFAYDDPGYLTQAAPYEIGSIQLSSEGIIKKQTNQSAYQAETLCRKKP